MTGKATKTFNVSGKIVGTRYTPDDGLRFMMLFNDPISTLMEVASDELTSNFERRMAETGQTAEELIAEIMQAARRKGQG